MKRPSIAASEDLAEAMIEVRNGMIAVKTSVSPAAMMVVCQQKPSRTVYASYTAAKKVDSYPLLDYFEQDKTDARLTVRWTLELWAVVERAKALHGENVRALTLLHNRRGKAPDYRTVRDQRDRACEAAAIADADLRDLRAMAGTAAKAQGKNPTALRGHTSPAMTHDILATRTSLS